MKDLYYEISEATERAERKYMAEQESGDAVSIASTRGHFLGLRDARDAVSRHRNAIRDLLVALEFLRCACEHSDGRTKNDEKQLAMAMSIGIRVGAAHAHLIADYQKPSFWADVHALPEKVL